VDQDSNKPSASENGDVPVTGHAYDGIEEFDNPLPNWWLVTLFATIIFAFIYYLHYTVGGAPTQLQELEADMKALPQVAKAQWNEADVTQKMNALSSLAKGKEIFQGRCASCHGPEGQGLIGPNLTDKFWIHGHGTRADLMQIISEGVLDKGMPAWATMISEDEVLNVAAFVHSLRATHPSNPKPPQGEEVHD
jgi:cytochrome c oxidase cbb3-type subunit 3